MVEKYILDSGENWSFSQDGFEDDLFCLEIEQAIFEVLAHKGGNVLEITLSKVMLEGIIRTYQTHIRKKSTPDTALTDEQLKA